MNISKTDVMVGMLLVLFLVASRIVIHATRDPNNKFNFNDAFLDVNGKTSLPRIAHMAALVVSVWGFIVLIITERMSEWYFTAFTSVFVLGAIGNKIFEKPTGDKNASPD